jgi:hypothetical protein
MARSEVRLQLHGVQGEEAAKRTRELITTRMTRSMTRAARADAAVLRRSNAPIRCTSQGIVRSAGIQFARTTFPCITVALHIFRLALRKRYSVQKAAVRLRPLISA